jgi:peptide/nickel transport system substrate-binding protein
MGTTKRTGRLRPGAVLTATLVSLALVAGACSKKDDGDSVSGGDDTTASTPASTGDTAADATTGATDGTDATATTAEETTTTVQDTIPVDEVTPGGKLIVSGEAEVANPWTPAAMQCDSYCLERAFSFYDPIAAVGDDLQVHGVLAESITPNADSTEWTVALRSGINFTDGTPVNADAVIYNLQATGTGLLVGNTIVDVAKVAAPTDDNPDAKALKIEKADDLTFTIFMGKRGDETQPLSWPGFAFLLTGQLGLVASPTWLEAVKADPTLASQPVGSGPFVYKSYAPRDALVVTKNPNYWQKDAAGNTLPYLDEIEFKVIEDSQTAQEALLNGEIDIFSTSTSQVIKDFRDVADDFPMNEQSDYVETNYLLIDHDKPGALQDARVRCALSKAINRQEVIDLSASGLGRVANGVFSPGQEGYLEDNGFDPAQDLEGAQTLIDEYLQETGESSVSINYGHTATAIGDQQAELFKGYWSEIGVETELQVVPQDKFINNALFGDPGFFIYGWRQHAGLKVDQQNHWWNSASAPPDGGLALNFARIRDEVVDQNLADARSNPDPAKRQAAAENVNRQMAKECHQIPISFTLWGTPHKPNVKGLAQYTLPDGAPARDGAGFSGQFWVNMLWIDANA